MTRTFNYLAQRFYGRNNAPCCTAITLAFSLAIITAGYTNSNSTANTAAISEAATSTRQSKTATSASNNDTATSQIRWELQTLRREYIHTPGEEQRSIIKSEIDARERQLAELNYTSANSASLTPQPAAKPAEFPTGALCLVAALAAGTFQLLRTRLQQQALQKSLAKIEILERVE